MFSTEKNWILKIMGILVHITLFDVLPKQITCEMKALQVYNLHSTKISCRRFHVLRSWRSSEDVLPI